MKNTSIRPLVHSGPGFYITLTALGLATAFLVYFYAKLIVGGLHLTDLRTGSATWGITVVNIIQLIAISHAGILISAIVRIFDLKAYKHFARMAELVTLVALPTAVLNIALDIGRPERFIINTFWYGRWQSPMVWSMTVISIYMLASAIYLYLSVRRDLALCAEKIPRRKWLYRLLALGYTDTDEERRRHEKVLWWLALIIIPIMISASSVYGLIFGVTATKHGWHNPLQAPYFVLGALVTGLAVIILLAALLRKVYGWEEFYRPMAFRKLGMVLGVVSFLYVYFYTSELIVGAYGWPKAADEVMRSLLSGRFAMLFWPNYILGFLGAVAILFVVFVSRRRKRILSITPILVASGLLIVATWVGRFLIVVPTYYVSNLPYPVIPYSPTAIEWAITLLTYAFAAFFYLLLIKLVPLVEFPVGPAPEISEDSVLHLRGQEMPAMLRKSLIAFTIFLGTALFVGGVFWGITGPDRPTGGAAATWVIGLLVLTAVPALICLVRPKILSHPERG